MFITLSRFEWTLFNRLVMGNTRQIVTKETMEEVLVMTSGCVGTIMSPWSPHGFLGDNI